MRRKDGNAADEVDGRAEDQAEGEEAETPGRTHAAYPPEPNRTNLCTATPLPLPTTGRQ
jgi:hypothetical protein